MKHSGMNCSEAGSHIPLYVGGDLERAVLDQVREHLRVCEACRTQARAAEAARGALLTLRDDLGEEQPDLWPGVRAALECEGGLGARRPARRDLVRET